MRSLLPAAALLTVALAACGGDDRERAGATVTERVTVTVPPVTTPTRPEAAATTAVAPPATTPAATAEAPPATTATAPAGGDGDPVGDRGRLTVAGDGCGVVRSGPADESRSLQWTVVDAEGFEVLERDAVGETRYRYYRPGRYRVVLKAFEGGRYVRVSNAVAIRC